MKKHLSVMILDECRRQGDRDALASKSGGAWKKISWKKMAEQIQQVGQGLLEFGVKPQENIAIFSPNRPEWAIADYGIMSARCVTVPVYATNSSEQAEYIVNDASIRIIFVGVQEQYDAVMKFFGKNEHLEKVIVFDRAVPIAKNEKIMYFSDFLEKGMASLRVGEFYRSLEEAREDDTSTIIYTSGTTGDPKGVVLTHANFFSQFKCLDEGFPMSRRDVALCFLPLSHAYEKCSDYWVQTHGAAIYYCDDPKKIIEYFQEVRPTYMVGVPRLYEKMYAAIYDKLEKASESKQKLFKNAIATGLEFNLKRLRREPIPFALRLRFFVARKLVLKKIRALLGGRLNFFSAGGAPLSHTIEEFFLAAGIFIGQGYGLTETSPCIAANNPKRFKFGSVGPLFSCNIVKIADDGEIMVKGENVTSGYYRKPAQTAEAFTEDGWFKTGDIGYLDSEGFLFITDRKKDLIVTAGGKNIAPQIVESMVGSDFYIEQIIIIGDNRKFVSALIVPSFEALEEYARSNGISWSSHEELVAKPEIQSFYEQRIAAQSASLSHAEQIKKFTLMPKAFSMEEGEITPTMKIKRKVIEKKYKDIIDAMYA